MSCDGKRVRLTAPERRAAVLDCACRVFAEGSYRGTTTAEIARAAGVTEPILYRHFPSKRALYLACLDSSWQDLKGLWERALLAESDPGCWVRAMALAYRDSGAFRDVMSTLWVQALAEASEDEEIGSFMRAHMEEVHAFVAGVHRRAQDAGGILPERDPDAEAWVFIALGLLRAVGDCLGGLVDDQFPVIGASRFTWLTGREA